MSAMASQITGVTIVCSTVCSSADQRKHQSSASLAFVRGIHRSPVNSPHKGPVMRKMFPFNDVIMHGNRQEWSLSDSLVLVAPERSPWWWYHVDYYISSYDACNGRPKTGQCDHQFSKETNEREKQQNCCSWTEHIWNGFTVGWPGTARTSWVDEGFGVSEDAPGSVDSKVLALCNHADTRPPAAPVRDSSLTFPTNSEPREAQDVSRGRFESADELLNPRALKASILY